MRIATTLAGAALLCSSVAATAGELPHRFTMPAPGSDRLMLLQTMAEELDLSDAQRAQIDAIHEGYRPRLDSLMQRMLQLDRALHGMDSQSSDFPVEADRLAGERGAVVTELARLEAQMRRETESVMTAEQRAALAARPPRRLHRVLHAPERSD